MYALYIRYVSWILKKKTNILKKYEIFAFIFLCLNKSIKYSYKVFTSGGCGYFIILIFGYAITIPQL